MGLLVKKYTAEEIHAAIVLSNIAMLNNMIELQKKSRVYTPEPVSTEYDRLSSLGLVNTKNAKLLKKKIDEIETINKGIDLYNANIDRQKEFYQFIKEMLEVFGHNTLLIRFDDFEQIVRKYNLTCGTLSDYTGSIPEKNILELEAAKKNLIIAKEVIHEEVEYKTYIRSPYLERVRTFPKYPSLYKNIWELKRIIKVDPDYVSKECRNAIKVFPFAKLSKYGSIEFLPGNFKHKGDGIKTSIRDAVDLFIVAPYKEMKEGVKFTHFVKSEDPFICSYTPFGIMIHTAWGEESEDEILDKYKKLIKEEVKYHGTNIQSRG